MHVQRCERIAPLRAALALHRRAGEAIGFVPTMGALHDGHLTLVETARRECQRVVVSIFVNPTQFGPGEDFNQYPRTLEEDCARLGSAGVDFVFLPQIAEMYPEPLATSVRVEPLGSDLIGAVRPGHFTGVATVVAKLLNIVQPERAYFGKKDFQQLAIVRRMVRDLSLPVEIVGVETVRERDGLAMSSRNMRLSRENRVAAKILSEALDLGAGMIAAGEGDPSLVLAAMRDLVDREPLAVLTSLDIRRASDLAPVEAIGSDPVVILITARFADVLLIDQREAAHETRSLLQAAGGR